MSATAAEVSEYDRFGPWIDEIAIPEDIPRLFRTFPIDLSSTRVVLKVPRSIARRDATAGMDLYDHLVILEQGSLTLLSRSVAASREVADSGGGRGYDVLSVPLADVVAIRDDLNLLDGRLTVSTVSGASIVVPYNGSAHDMATRLVNALRAAASAAPASAIGSALRRAGEAMGHPAAPLPEHADTHFVTRFLELRGDYPDLVTWTSHGRRRLAPAGRGLRGFVARVAHALSPMTMHGAAVIADANAVEVLGRHASLVRGRDPVYSSSRLVVPLGALDRLEVSAHPLYPGATVVTLGAGEWATEFAVPSGSDAELMWRATAAR